MGARIILAGTKTRTRTESSGTTTRTRLAKTWTSARLFLVLILVHVLASIFLYFSLKARSFVLDPVLASLVFVLFS